MIDQHLISLLYRQRGDNRKLALEVVEKLSPQSRDRLFRVLQDMQQEASSERNKRRQGRF